MDKMDFNLQAERYKKEMMKLYCQRQEETQPVPEVIEETVSLPRNDEIIEETVPLPRNDQIIEETVSIPRNDEIIEEGVPSEESLDITEEPLSDEEIFNVDEDAPDDSAWSPHSENDMESTPEVEDEYNTKYPEPDISEFTVGSQNQNITPPEYVSEESLGDSYGYILVNVRTGDESSAIENATVLVTAIVDGNRMIIASGRTNANGTTTKFKIPAPDVKHSQAPNSIKRPYNLFDVSVSAEGFFNARSVDVPVFAGITSIQNFNMIPVPSMMNSSDETLTYFNQEPVFPNNSEGE